MKAITEELKNCIQLQQNLKQIGTINAMMIKDQNHVK